ncbi:hypothetical protein [Caldimonas tepidiphila]|uniref:hypothetical protein n=1 Tax=Caldimonas tepidiphila TaxID=2315841 RepID=UPI0014749607|nr:hypothetical protein [Caldimonas tepidiphila]
MSPAHWKTGALCRAMQSRARGTTEALSADPAGTLARRQERRSAQETADIGREATWRHALMLGPALPSADAVAPGEPPQTDRSHGELSCCTGPLATDGFSPAPTHDAPASGGRLGLQAA